MIVSPCPETSCPYSPKRSKLRETCYDPSALSNDGPEGVQVARAFGFPILGLRLSGFSGSCDKPE